MNRTAWRKESNGTPMVRDANALGTHARTPPSAVTDMTWNAPSLETQEPSPTPESE